MVSADNILFSKSNFLAHEGDTVTWHFIPELLIIYEFSDTINKEVAVFSLFLSIFLQFCRISVDIILMVFWPSNCLNNTRIEEKISYDKYFSFKPFPILIDKVFYCYSLRKATNWRLNHRLVALIGLAQTYKRQNRWEWVGKLTLLLPFHWNKQTKSTFLFQMYFAVFWTFMIKEGSGGRCFL